MGHLAPSVQRAGSGMAGPFLRQRGKSRGTGAACARATSSAGAVSARRTTNTVARAIMKMARPATVEPAITEERVERRLD